MTALRQSIIEFVARKDLVGSATEAIDDCGFEVDVIKIEPLITLTPANNATAAGPRKLSLRVDVLHCHSSTSIVLLAVTDADLDNRFAAAAIFAASDPIWGEATGAIRHFQEQGAGTWMISGDNEATAKAVAKSVGIPEMNAIAGVLPQQKAENILLRDGNVCQAGPRQMSAVPSQWLGMVLMSVKR
ncbi:hypothetical protein BDR05DRAFT_1005891 [Suillus weaverae]|nr:hypothetical protein BDR05DRAFT_1005891 [Suillus weaverae]